MSHLRLKSGALSPRVKVWLEIDGRYAFGLGIAEILQSVDQAGSIKRAAAALGKSYRYVWGRVKAAERALGQPLVETHVGGGTPRRSTLTPLARRYADAFLQLRRRMKELVADEFARQFV
jgi:molybdate transport repressor ModE-like protein